MENNTQNIEDVHVQEGMDVYMEKWSFKKLLRYLKNGRLIVDKTFQRDEVYKIPQKSGLILSGIRGRLIPPIDVFEDQERSQKKGHTVYSILDGQQRVSSIRDFMLNKYELQVPYGPLPSLNGYTLDMIRKIHPELAEEIEDLTLDVNIIRNISKKEAQEYFGLINTTTVPLSPGERLWSITDPVKPVLEEIAESNSFKITNLRKSRKGEYVVATKLLWNSLFKNPLNHDFVGNEIKSFLDYFNTVDMEAMTRINHEKENVLRLLDIYGEIVENTQYSPRSQNDFYNTVCFISVLDRKNEISIDNLSKFINWLFRGINKQRYPFNLRNDFEKLIHHKLSRQTGSKEWVITLEKLYNEEVNTWSK